MQHLLANNFAIVTVTIKLTA